MKNTIALLTPTRSRLRDITELVRTWKETTEGNSDFIFGIDDDDNTYNSFIKENPDFTFEVNPRMKLVPYLNFLALKYCNEYKYLSFLEDDFRFESNNWESIFIKKLEEVKVGIAWGADGIHNGKLVDSPVMTSNIVKTLGYMIPPTIECLFADHFLLHIGREANILHYFPNVKIIHHHYSTGKREKDDISVGIENSGIRDGIAWHNYLKDGSFVKDCDKLKDLQKTL